MELENRLYDFLVCNDICTEEEANLVTSINGFNEKFLLDILYVRTGLHSYEQAIDEGYEGSEYLNEYYDI